MRRSEAKGESEMALIEGKRGLGIGLRLAIAFSLALSAV